MDTLITTSQKVEANHCNTILSTVAQANETSGFTVKWARHLDEVRRAQRLRYSVFCEEMGAKLNSKIEGHDIDEFDDHCEHLLVMPTNSDRVIGTYRLLTPLAAKRIGRYYSEQEFDLCGLEHLRGRIVELGRSCVHPEFRQGGVIMGLWSGLAAFMKHNKLDFMMGCASIPMLRNGVLSLDYAIDVWHQIQSGHHMTPIQHAIPKLALPLEQSNFNTAKTDIPPLIKGYLRLGAKVMGIPAWDPDFNTADLPILMNWSDLSPRYARHFDQLQSNLKFDS